MFELLSVSVFRSINFLKAEILNVYRIQIHDSVFVRLVVNTGHPLCLVGREQRYHRDWRPLWYLEIDVALSVVSQEHYPSSQTYRRVISALPPRPGQSVRRPNTRWCSE